MDFACEECVNVWNVKQFRIEWWYWSGSEFVCLFLSNVLLKSSCNVPVYEQWCLEAICGSKHYLSVSTISILYTFISHESNRHHLFEKFVDRHHIVVHWFFCNCHWLNTDKNELEHRKLLHSYLIHLNGFDDCVIFR